MPEELRNKIYHRLYQAENRATDGRLAYEFLAK